MQCIIFPDPPFLTCQKIVTHPQFFIAHPHLYFMTGPSATSCSCVILAKQVAATRRRFGAHAVISLACVASVSVWFRSKEKPRKGTFGFDRARKETRAAFLLAPLFSRSLACVAGVERGRCFSPPPLPFLLPPRRLRGLWLSFFSAKPHRNACYAGYNLVLRGMWTSFLIQHGWPYDVLSLFHLYFVAATCCRKCTHGATTLLSLILSPRLVRLIAATKFCRSDNDFHKINRVTQGDGIVAATCPRDVSQRRSDLSASVSRLPRPLQISSLTAHGCFFDNLITR